MGPDNEASGSGKAAPISVLELCPSFFSCTRSQPSHSCSHGAPSTQVSFATAVPTFLPQATDSHPSNDPFSILQSSSSTNIRDRREWPES